MLNDTYFKVKSRVKKKEKTMNLQNAEFPIIISLELTDTTVSQSHYCIPRKRPGRYSITKCTFSTICFLFGSQCSSHASVHGHW